IGVLGVFLASNNSINLGSPNVTDTSATPAKWNTFRVIWVPGSPIDSAVMIPIASPGSINADSYSFFTLSKTFSVSFEFSFWLMHNSLASSINFSGNIPEYCSEMSLTICLHLLNNFLDIYGAAFAFAYIYAVITISELHYFLIGISDCVVIFYF